MVWEVARFSLTASLWRELIVRYTVLTSALGVLVCSPLRYCWASLVSLGWVLAPGPWALS